LFTIKPGFFDSYAWYKFKTEFKKLKDSEEFIHLMNSQNNPNNQTVLHLASAFPLKYFADLLDNPGVNIYLHP
jgi:hypothetical protein